MRVHSVIVLLEGCKTSAAVVLRAAASLLVTEVLTSVGSEETFGDAPHVSHLNKRDTTLSGKVCNLPTCSAFSQLLFILDWLSGSGNGSS